ncbi:MAG: hypothetical protein SGPRY_009752 [Prymnesium sp.]
MFVCHRTARRSVKMHESVFHAFLSMEGLSSEAELVQVLGRLQWKILLLELYVSFYIYLNEAVFLYSFTK